MKIKFKSLKLKFKKFSLGFCLNEVGVLHDSLKQKFNNLEDDFEYFFNLMYSVYSLPNIILPFIGGILITKFGNSLMYFIFALLILIGQIIFYCGIISDSIYIVLIGRFVYGWGGECLDITQYNILIKWFPKNQIGLPYGLSITGYLIAPSINNIITPYLAAVILAFISYF